MKDEPQNIFTAAYTDDLLAELRAGNILSTYFDKAFTANAAGVLPSTTIVTNGEAPKLVPDVSAEVENAIALYEYYPNLDNTQASDKRFWTYLSHVTFRDYVQNRWGPAGTFEDIKNNPAAQKTAIDNVAQHWFIQPGGGVDRKLRRHALARLWWAARLTAAPWRDDEKTFELLADNNPYIYTPILLSSEDMYLQTMERAPFKSPVVRFATLEFLRRNPDFQKRELYRRLMIEITLASSIKRLHLLPVKDVIDIVGSLAG